MFLLVHAIYNLRLTFLEEEEDLCIDLEVRYKGAHPFDV